MHFRIMLLYLQTLSDAGWKEFESRNVALMLRYSPEAMNLPPAKKKLLETKSISNDLNRLCQMRFLKRERVKRQVVLTNGKKAFKGFKYVYTLSNQGRSYIDFMFGAMNPKSNPEVLMDKMAASAHQFLPLDTYLLAEDVYNIFYRMPRKTDARFPGRKQKR